MRRERLTVAIAQHSLAGAIARADEQLDAEIEASAAIRAVREVKLESPDAPSGPRVKTARDEEAPWGDEIAVVRACVKNGPPIARGRNIGGSLGRMIDKQATGTTGIATSTRAYEPDLGSDHYRHAWKCWQSLPWEEREYLAAMFVGVDSSTDGGADKIAKTIRGHLQHGKVSEAEAALPAFATAFSSDGMQIEKATNANTLLAIRLGWWRADASSLHEWPDSGAVKRTISAARAKLKKALHEMPDLDASGESLRSADYASGERLASGTKPRLIPRPSSAERQRELADVRTVPACIGLGAVVDGAREDCATDVRTVDVNSADRCGACGRWRA